jgi:hypothetical protein
MPLLRSHVPPQAIHPHFSHTHDPPGRAHLSGAPTAPGRPSGGGRPLQWRRPAAALGRTTDPASVVLEQPGGRPTAALAASHPPLQLLLLVRCWTLLLLRLPPGLQHLRKLLLQMLMSYPLQCPAVTVHAAIGAPAAAADIAGWCCAGLGHPQCLLDRCCCAGAPWYGPAVPLRPPHRLCPPCGRFLSCYCYPCCHHCCCCCCCYVHRRRPHCVGLLRGGTPRQSQAA